MHVLEKCGDYGAFQSLKMRKLVTVEENRSQNRDLEEVSIDTSSLVSLDTRQ